ncbi:MAG TPA: hypothetical protein VLA49_16005 [Anaerolineales bacterium]|nr:hypothetical protein [Anaerolineales bacterium]
MTSIKLQVEPTILLHIGLTLVPAFLGSKVFQRAGEIGKAKLGPDVWASEGAPE